MENICFISYSQGVLQKIVPLLELQGNVTILNEKNSLTKEFSEIWLDAYIDMYDPRLIDPQYLYHFFLRLHQILDTINLKKTTVRLFQNFYHQTQYEELRKICSLYKSFTEFLCTAYHTFPLYIPDILDERFVYHPYNIMKSNSKQSLLWHKESTIRVIHPNDVVYNIYENTLKNSPYIIAGIKVSLEEMSQKVSHIFGNSSQIFDNAYQFSVCDEIQGIALSEYRYNLESICMTQL